jgi:hypothetical protein
MTQPFWDIESPAIRQFFQAGVPGTLWQTAWLGGVQLPGLVNVDLGDGPGRKWDIKSPPGTDGAVYTDQGFEGAPVTLTVTLWTPDHWKAWQALLPGILPKPGKGTKKPPAPRALVHPDANALGVTGVIVLNVSGLKSAGPGMKQATIKAAQWVKPKKAAIYTPNATLQVETAAATEGAPAAPSRSGNTPS